MKKKFSILLSLIVLTLIIVVVLFNNKLALSYDNTQKEKQYLYVDTVDNFNHLLYEFNVNSKEKKMLFKKSIEDYPTSAYSKKNNKVYFTKRLSDKSTQLFEKDLKNNVTKQLTKELSFIDLLSLNESENILYMRVLVGNDDRNFHVARYNLKTLKYQVWNLEDKDTSVVTFDFNSKLKKLLILTKSIKEEFENIDKANKNNKAPKPPRYRFLISPSDKFLPKEVLTLKKFVKSGSISNDEKTLLINYKDGLESNKPSKVVKYLIDEGDMKLIIQDSDQNFDIRQPLFNLNNNGFYFISDENETGSSSIVQYFNLKTKEIEKVFYNEKGPIINLYR